MYVVHRGNTPISEHASYDEAKQKADRLNRVMASYARDERVKPYGLKLTSRAWPPEPQRHSERARIRPPNSVD